jgi:photosystem II stability/assembly factor-like uncharacterized protein
MRIRQLTLVLSVLLTLCLCCATQAQEVGRIESMKLLTPDVGWAATSKKLFWTSDGGAHWKDITPRTEAQRSILSVFFVDAASGWALLAYSGKENPKTSISETLFDLASTNDSGASWSVQHLDVPDPDPSRGLSGEAWLDFADSQHGWIEIRMNGSTAMSIGVLRATDDGGKTWRSLGVPAAGPIRFVTPTDGWLEGGPTEDVTQGIYVTRDGGKDWTIVTLKAPPEIRPNVHPTYELPEFIDKNTGLLLVTFSEPNDEAPTLALFTTKDGGQTWNLGSTLDEGETSWQTTTASSGWLAAGCPGGRFALVRAHIETASKTSPAESSSGSICTIAGGGIVQITFASTNRGWLLLSSGELFATQDGGITWEKMTPSAAVYNRASDTLITAPQEFPAIGDVFSMSPFTNLPAAVSTHLGFDRYPVIPSGDMGNWWKRSPYYDVGIYLPGSKNKGTDANLLPSWVTAVQKQGWGIIPIWFGVQSPCSCYVDQTGQCVPFTYQFSSNPTQDGTNEAIAAVLSAQKLGLNPTIIYKNIEYYTPSPKCSPAVTQFLNGWDKQMQMVGKAGVYGNPAPAAQDFSKALPPPDDVWIAKYPNAGQAPQITIWSLGALPDSLSGGNGWSDNQRIHQFQQNIFQTWGSVTRYKIDPDIDNATIVAGTGAKVLSSYNFTNIDCAGAIATYAYGINDMNGSAFINGPGQTGTIVGSYSDSSNKLHGFKYNRGACTSIDISGAVATSVQGINNNGSIVGFWDDSNSVNHSFLLVPGNQPVPIKYPSASDTFALGINDAGQIVGTLFTYPDFSGFLFYRDVYFPPIEYPGTHGLTQVNGINGNADIVGDMLGSNGNLQDSFVEYAFPPSWAGNFSAYGYAGASSTSGDAINNDNDEVGAYLLSNGSVLGFVLTGSGASSSLQYPGSTYTVANSINDFGQIVGYYTDSKGAYHGFVAVPQ